jgi:hypothetical protein
LPGLFSLRYLFGVRSYVTTLARIDFLEDRIQMLLAVFAATYQLNEVYVSSVSTSSSSSQDDDEDGGSILDYILSWFS